LALYRAEEGKHTGGGEDKELREKERRRRKIACWV
jgi:hypothetical protein